MSNDVRIFLLNEAVRRRWYYLTLHPLTDHLVFLPLLRRLREGVLHVPNGASQGLKDVVLAYPGEQEIQAAKHQERDLEGWADARELHELAEPVRWRKDHVYDYGKREQNCRHKRV